MSIRLKEEKKEMCSAIFFGFLKLGPVHTGYPRRREGRSLESLPFRLFDWDPFPDWVPSAMR
jgi:hypothetical protein